MSRAALRPGDKVVLTTFGTYGDIAPFVAVGCALARRGIRVTVATSSYYQELVERHGLRFAPGAPSEAELRRDLGMEVPEIMRRAMHKVTGAQFASGRVVNPYLSQTYDQLTQACVNARMVISHSYSFAVPLLVEATGIQWRSLCLQPLALLSEFDAPVLSELLPLHRLQPLLGPQRYALVHNLVKRATRAWVREVDQERELRGLPAASRHPLFEGSVAPDGCFAMFDPMLMPDKRGLPATLSWAGFCHSDATTEAMDPALERFLAEGPAPVVFTLGTSAVHAPGEFYAAASEAAVRLRLRAVFLTGHQPTGGLPPGQLSLRWASHAQLFPRCRAVVHQGGMGTTAQALRAGIPHLVVPYGNDQPDNAARLHRLGVGDTLRSWRVNGRAMQRSLEALTEPSYAEAARALQAQLQPEDGAELVAKALCDGQVG